MLATFAALCFVIPPAVQAFGHGEATAECMAHADMIDHGNVASPATGKHHGDHSSPTAGHQPSCCGLFCMSAVLANSDTVAPLVVSSVVFAVRDPRPAARPPHRLDRPPISPRFV